MIEVSGLTKTYGKKRGIDRISFTIEEGEIVGFLGPNGAGKTTTMNIIIRISIIINTIMATPAMIITITITIIMRMIFLIISA